MDWQPISELELWNRINGAEARMSPQQEKFWSVIRIPPEKWQLLKWGDAGDGFWAVAVLGQTVIWYNDIEDGFNCSLYVRQGVISDYWCNQDDLEHAVQRLINGAESGRPLDGAFAPPRPGP